MGSGRKVTGKLIQDPVTGYWREETAVEAIRAQGALVADRILEAFRAGATRVEIALAIAEERGASRKERATIYRSVDQVLLDAGIREKEEKSRVPHRRDPNGTADLPTALEVTA